MSSKDFVDLGSGQRINRRDTIRLMAAAGITLSASSVFAQQGQASSLLRIGAYANPTSLDPAASNSSSDNVYFSILYDSLVSLDEESLLPQPGLAKSFRFVDPTTLVMNLVEGVKFQDGTSLDAEAVKFNLERYRDDPASSRRSDLARVKAVDVTSEYEVKLTLDEPDPSVVLFLGGRTGCMVSPKALKEAGGRVDRTPVGVGPWKLVSWADGDRLIFEASTGYWQADLPRSKNLEAIIIADSSARFRALQSGQIDMALQLSSRQLPLLEKNPELVTLSGPSLFVYHFYMNNSRGAMKDPRVRRALSLAIDRDAFVRATMQGGAEPTTQYYPKGHWAYVPALDEAPSYDPQKAKELLAEAGYPDGLELDFRGYSDQESVQRQEVLMNLFNQVGIRGKFTNAPLAEAISKFFGEEKAGDLLLSALPGQPDPLMAYTMIYDEASFYNAGRVAPPEAAAKGMQESRLTQNQDERAAALAQVAVAAIEDGLSIPLAIRFDIIGLSKNVSGFERHLLGTHRFQDVAVSA